MDANPSGMVILLAKLAFMMDLQVFVTARCYEVQFSLIIKINKC